MANSAKKDAFGFFTVVELADQSLVGGLLVLNAAARPLEFHCTAPVAANRAQQILYGPTLAPYLIGEQIGATLVKAVKNELSLILTDTEAALSVRGLIDLPVVLVATDELLPKAAPDNRAQQTLQFGAAKSGAPQVDSSFQLHGRGVRTADGFAGDKQLALAAGEGLADSFDLSEPFDRIREALAEAQGGAA